jgi:hypothetical protein
MPDEVSPSFPGLSRFRPLSRILFFDDFDQGPSGWTELIGNYESSLDNVLPEWRDCRPPMLSQAAMWDTGSAGSIDGTYSLKLATRPERGHIACAIKRLTFAQAAVIKLETYFTVKPEGGGTEPLETDVRGFGLLFDLQSDTARAMPHLRYHNADDGALVQQWQYRTRASPRRRVGGATGLGSTYHLAPEDWIDIPSAAQPLCRNEIVTKQNWHYLAVRVDLASLSFIDLRCNDRLWDLGGLEEIRLPLEPTLSQMLNSTFFVEAGAHRRSFLYLDSVLLSADQL